MTFLPLTPALSLKGLTLIHIFFREGWNFLEWHRSDRPPVLEE